MEREEGNGRKGEGKGEEGKERREGEGRGGDSNPLTHVLYGAVHTLLKQIYVTNIITPIITTGTQVRS